MTAVSGTIAAEWSPYDFRRVPRSRVRDFATRGNVEYELCIEGGSDVIRRTEHHESGEPTIMETGRDRRRLDVLDLWKLIVMGAVS